MNSGLLQATMTVLSAKLKKIIKGGCHKGAKEQAKNSAQGLNEKKK